jgi:glutaminyl-peptide cyclotransferase
MAVGLIAIAVVAALTRLPSSDGYDARVPAVSPGGAGAPETAESSRDTQGGLAYYGYRIVNAYPHDSRAYTQGLIYRDGFLYESTGLNGRSTLRKVRLQTGEVVQEHRVDPRYFAEGLTDWGNRLIQLTWQTNVGFVYDLATFSPVRTFPYQGEGWGLTHDGKRLIMSDGQPAGQLRLLDPASFKETGRLTVRDSGRPVKDLNELEFVRGEVFANVWQTDRICRIDLQSGNVIGWIDLAGLLPAAQRPDPDAVLNGIAYDAAGDRLFVTGKLWPRLFEIRLERRQR